MTAFLVTWSWMTVKKPDPGMTGKTSSSLQAVGVIHICFFSKHHIYRSYLFQFPSLLSSNQKPPSRWQKIGTQKRSFLEVTLHRSEGQHTMMLETHNDAWYTGNNASMHSMVLAMNLAEAMILLNWVSTEWNAVSNYPCNSCRHIIMKVPPIVKISFSRLC